MFKQIFQNAKKRFLSLTESRSLMLIVLFAVMALVLLTRLFYLQIVKGQEYTDNYELQIQKTRDVEGTRGNIYDRNGTLLATNELAYAIKIEDNGEYETTEEKNKALNATITTVIQMIEENGDSVINDFGIILDDDDNYMFLADSKTQRLRFIADVYGQAKTDDLTSRQKNQTAQEIIDYLCTDETYGYGIDQEALDKTEVLKLVNVRYAISLNSYQKYIPTTIAEDVSDETVADVMEHLDELQGVDVQEESIRRYTNAECFANLIGYTGKISTEEYEALSEEEQEEYDKTDTIGKAGLEQSMDSVLRGKDGSEKLYVNNVGKVIETVQGEDPQAGNDLYLSIDADLQVAAYNIIEQELAGILLSKIQNTLSFDRTTVSDGSDVIIPIGDVYNAFIDNDILDIDHFTADDAGTAEQEVSKSFASRKETVTEKLAEILKDPDGKAYQDLTQEYQAYLTYIVTDFLTTEKEIIQTDRIDTNDETYQAWKTDESINVYTYLSYAISQNWIDTSALQDLIETGEKYTDATEIYEGLVQYVLDEISDDTSFDKLVYKYMIKSGKLTGRQISMMLYEQGVLEYDEDQYNRLNAGSLGAYDFIRGKIEDLKITPGQLGLEPCTGSLVMTDTDTGQVLACVSYPGYDNNRLANSMDSDYYNKLVTDSARPFYNNATQEKTAPGSTYKPLTAVAGLTEGVISTGDFLSCAGIYEKVEPNPKCWAYPDSHGSLNVSEAIEHSCNCFFYEVGYRLSLKSSGLDNIDGDEDDGSSTKRYYSSDEGTSKLAKYAEAFGLGETSGVEIPEAEPEISDESSVPSAIGQGTNNYTTTQLARYVTAVANKGTVYKLTLLDHTETADGKTLETYEPEITNTMDEVSDETWEAVHTGMRNVVYSEQSSIFTEINRSDLKLSGKTGTAQQSKTHPDHGLFIGFAPSDSPEVAFAIRIANGYSSHNAAEIGKDVMKYYYKLSSEKEIITGKAKEIKESSGGD